MRDNNPGSRRQENSLRIGVRGQGGSDSVDDLNLQVWMGALDGGNGTVPHGGSGRHF